MKRELPDQLMFIANPRAVQKTTDASMRGKVCVVTGSTSGVGLEALRRLARGGAQLVMVCRNRQKAEAIREETASRHGVRVDIVTADFRDLGAVRAAAGVLLDSCPRIDVLINSVGMHSTTRTTTAAGLETVFCVNHLAPFRGTPLQQRRPRRPLLGEAPQHGAAELRSLQNGPAPECVGVRRPPGGLRRHHQRHASRGRAHQHR
jgi:NAD(P)-dependent dehydrogenase (short-subunit alcohol dehydrogenase family)